MCVLVRVREWGGFVMQLNKFSYKGKGAASSRARRPALTGNAKWDHLDNDALHEIFRHFDDRQLGRLAQLDRRTRRVAYASTQTRLGLSDSQWAAFKAVMHRRESVLLMGTPGSGKSFLLNVLSARMRDPLLTASTGAAAERIGAWTLHSALGLGLADKPAKDIVKKLRAPSRGGRYYPKPCQTCDVIIVDEVSMLTAKTLDLAQEVVGMMRNRGMPQIVVSGDPMQLGAVGADKDGSFVDSKLVKTLRPYVLVESFRQAEDSHFLSILNRARLGCAEPDDLDWLVANSSQDIGPDAPRLFCRVNQVADYNDCKLATLPAPSIVYTTTEQGDVPRRSSSYTDSVLRLKVGARVMLTSNLTGHVGVHNGSCGTVYAHDAQRVVVNFDNGRTLPIRLVTTEYKKGKDDDVVGSRTEMPLILAWAVSIHRAQGATLDSMAVDLSKAFAKGHAYVALSRVREVEHVQILGSLSITTLNNVDKHALGWYNDCAQRSADRAKRHRAREKKAERDAYEEQADEAALNAAMDAFEAAGGRGAHKTTD